VSLLVGLIAASLSLTVYARDEPVSAFFDAGGVNIHYLVCGKGEPVVLIHGLHSSAEMNWSWPGIVAALAAKYQVIAIDMPGHGSSDKPEKDDAYGAQMAEDVVLLLDHLKIERAHMVGYSMGGMVAMKLITVHPQRVISCILGGMGWLRAGSPLQSFWEKMQVREGSRTPAPCIHGLGKLAVTEDEVKAVKLPVTVIVGDRDPVKKIYVDPLQAARKDWPVIEIKDAGHINCVLKTQFKEEIARWLDAHAAK
jgi:pimeloyl-ACP methyl ester carboxylesterase